MYVLCLLRSFVEAAVLKLHQVRDIAD